MMATKLSERFNQPVPIAPLVTFRIVFGILMLFSILRFWYRGWIGTVYVTPRFHFTYQGFEWVKPMGEKGMYILFTIIVLACLCIVLGLLYRLAAVIFFLGFTYVELLDVTTYLNHYYFISLVAFILIWLPANRQYALDVKIWPDIRANMVPAWTIGLLRFQMGIVYFFAGLAKLNADWLFDAQPLRMWLPAKTHLPLVGGLMYKTWVAYAFAWFGAAYDLFIVFFMLNRRTRPVAYLFVIGFHVATAIFFPGIGMFPYVMITCSLVFFSADFHQKLLPFYNTAGNTYRFHHPAAMRTLVITYVIIQLLLPLRFILYPGHLFWHEEGYRFSWRVMLMEKSGAAYFTVKDAAHTQTLTVNNAEFLTPLQEKMMSTQPDMILKYAHHLAKQYEARGMKNPEVYGEIYVSLNGQRSRLFIDSTVNLAAKPVSWLHYDWVLPYKDAK